MSKKIIIIGSDHGGYALKIQLLPYLIGLGYEIEDKGCDSDASIDYPDFGHAVATEVLSSGNIGILICGSGNGINMTANKHAGIRAALCWTEEIAALARQHNNANILTLPGRFISEDLAKAMVKTFLTTDFEGGRHQIRIDKIN
jgi:ribose 5-phosphate isomerase B